MRVITSVCLLSIAIGVSGCGLGGSPAKDAGIAATSVDMASVKVILTSQTPVPEDRRALLDQIQKDTGAVSVSFISKLSSDTFVLAVETRQSTEALLLALHKIRYLKFVELDVKAKHH